MPRPVTRGRLLGAAALFSAPGAAVLTVLAIFHLLSLGAAAVGMAAMLLLNALLLRPYLKNLTTIAEWARALPAEPELPVPQIAPDPAAEDLVSALSQLRRSWQGREAELASSAARNETLFDNLPDPLILLDESRRVVRSNRAARQVFGRELKGRDLAAILRAPEVLEAAEEVLSGREVGTVTEFTLPLPVEMTFRVRVERLDVGPLDTGVAVLALHDLTAIKRIEQMRADFVANASHELRTPLAALLGFIETLRGPARDDGEARERFLSIMFEQASRMARLINDLLSLSHIELNEHAQPSETVDLGHIVESCVAALQPLAQAKSVSLEADLDPAARQVVGQADELAQLVQNLLDNAVKYGRDGTPVQVRLSAAAQLPASAGPALRPQSTIVLSVRDHGEGIAKEHLPRLTERFYRVDTARSRKLGGTGLGLAIVKHIVNRHRGVLAVESVVGDGSTFSVYLPSPAG